MFLPHEVMGCIYDFDRELFHKFFGFVVYSQAIWDADDLIVPVRLYGDGAESYRTQNFEIFILQSVLGEASQRAKAGRRICGEYTVVLDAFQMDQEFITKCFRLQSFSSATTAND
ncbi:hypothetical protein AK812_SmicGene36483 [Symbiodinium microadriaticum]|uniref:Uncharacterized protein n=1 Tax=Symbiodinium microadriaticum TaxID=2951 RepID=A0A1Q9CIS5_SYMMI|nr:hypothetical protein AK812_SmicGene36483 [Symbiodinium microadriaticum]